MKTVFTAQRGSNETVRRHLWVMDWHKVNAQHVFMAPLHVCFLSGSLSLWAWQSQDKVLQRPSQSQGLVSCCHEGWGLWEGPEDRMADGVPVVAPEVPAASFLQHPRARCPLCPPALSRPTLGGSSVCRSLLAG